ncbi:DUF2937 family protein [Alteromonas aestuariivivens]|uniref:DUF2937 family protein n=1 Tax=Alteromonas aestuariivivens TaxID=1938339 RepID=A0A3D8M3J9_9ALTE|nr:DUF2937 family protein [Alteromonas aestuariivivens]
MIVRIIDKIGFAVLLLLALQIPILADHYRQYLSGYYDATARQVAEYQSMADEFGYPTVTEMINALERNSSPIVQKDAQYKLRTLAEHRQLESGLSTLKNGHYFQQAWYMLAPKQRATLARVLENFSPSVPLTPSAIVYSLITAILANLLLWTPFWLFRTGKAIHARRQHKKQLQGLLNRV